MSRWSRRTEEEKSRISREQVEMRNRPPTPVKLPFAHAKADSASASKIWTDGEIPLLCYNHGWVRSEKYRMVIEAWMPGMPDQLMVVGTCEKCNKPIRKAVEMSDHTFVGFLVLVMPKLMKDGRFKDECGFVAGTDNEGWLG